jgi:hypothetical protein
MAKPPLTSSARSLWWWLGMGLPRAPTRRPTRARVPVSGSITGRSANDLLQRVRRAQTCWAKNASVRAHASRAAATR